MPTAKQTKALMWRFILGRLREACGDNFEKLAGIVEIDEAYIGGKERNKHASKRGDRQHGSAGKAIVLGMRERGGRTKAMTVPANDQATLEFAILDSVETGSIIHTDEGPAYQGLRHLDYAHATVNHRVGEYARDGVSTNSIEAVWAVLKRGIYGTFHHVSEKHLDRYVAEFTFRLNEGNVERHTMQRLDSFVDGVAGKRLTYKALIG